MAQSKRWQFATPAPRDFIHSAADRPGAYWPVIAQVLYNRGFDQPAAAAAFLNVDKLEMGSFLAIRRRGSSAIDNAIARIKRAIKYRDQIVVYGDFDADGVTSTALLTQTLLALGANVRPYIPHRVDEGYGLNNDALLRLKREGAKLIITVDCGIRSVEEVEYGTVQERLDIIVTDHHSIGPEVPRAHAVINPKLTDLAYPESMLAGVGVAFRLAEALLITCKGLVKPGTPLPTPDDLLDLVAIGTVADLAPLNRPENRLLVKRGLQAINAAQRPGIRALLDVCNVPPGQATAQTIGYALGPRINAAGRLGSALDALHLLLAADLTAAMRLAAQLQALNVRRQELTHAAQEQIRQQMAAHAIDPAAPLIFASGDFEPGIVGLVAGRLTEEFYRPAVVLHAHAEPGEDPASADPDDPLSGESRASCRSIPEFDITHALDQCADLLVRHGGHAQAAGFTIRNRNLPIFKDRLLAIAHGTLAGQELIPTLWIDAELSPREITLPLADALAALEPTGHQHGQPVFATHGLRVLEARPVGREGQHLKLKLNRPDGPPLDAIGFHMYTNGGAALRPGDFVDIAYTLEADTWNDVRSAKLKLEDVRLHQPG